MGRAGFTRGPNSGIAEKDLIELHKKVQAWIDDGFWQQAAEAITQAREMTRDWIRQDFPSPAFGGKDLRTIGGSVKENKRGQEYYADLSQFRLGHFGMIGKNGRSRGHADNGTICSLNIYANYFARWYTTGSSGHTAQNGTRVSGYSPHGQYWEGAHDRIVEHFSGLVQKYFDENMKL